LYHRRLFFMQVEIEMVYVVTLYLETGAMRANLKLKCLIDFLLSLLGSLLRNVSPARWMGLGG
jgi:hypothetical protein